MGEDGLKIAAKMATGTNKYVASMSIALRGLEQTARASLKAFTTDLNHAFGNQSIFQQNLAQLAAQGFGDLAARLADQNDQAAYDLAAAAVSDKGKASKANTASRNAEKAPPGQRRPDRNIAGLHKTKVPRRRREDGSRRGRDHRGRQQGQGADHEEPGLPRRTVPVRPREGEQRPCRYPGRRDPSAPHTRPRRHPIPACRASLAARRTYPSARRSGATAIRLPSSPIVPKQNGM
ncbi:hypothetical protein [Streptomyces sp. DHE17-7]|uniref:hypothetical protein n=1 Tax=Streptomyces sp. DHE17-7 TaxID=2759949 RepID=UPI0022EA1075|nr:hypothetical protein [Streptomyces sp. DHE17-7]MBJ6623484.1 hypothetical protein [Streptomyces sp. DHE17-7]